MSRRKSLHKTPQGAPRKKTGEGAHDLARKRRLDEDERSVSERVDEQRAILLREKQIELDGILDRHDDLIREAFHLDHFRTLVSYDPKVAKADTSSAFQKWKAQHYDLIGTSASTSGPSRRTTRRAHNERVELLKGPVAGPSTSTSPSTAANDTSAHPRGQSGNDAVLSTSTKGKGKDKATPKTPKASKGEGATKTWSAPELSESASAPAAPTTGRGRGKRRIIRDEIASPALADNSMSTPVPAGRRKNHVSSPLLASADAYPDSTPDLKAPPRKRRKTDSADPDQVFSSPSVPPAHPAHPLPLSASTSKYRRGRVVDPENPHASPSTLPRVKLIVRRPKPVYTNPRQKPVPATPFGKSVSAFLTSYTNIDGRDVDETVLDNAARKEAKFLEHVYALRQQGRLLLRADQALSVDRKQVPGEPKRGMDVWDHVLQDVRLRRRAGDGAAQRVTATIVKGVKTYWDNNAAKEGKAKHLEMKRLRALAKATMKLVINDWKKAVFHIREQERLKREAEEKQRGREHLDAILDQSGQILETQQIELSRGGMSRSRSSSVSATQREWDDEEDDEEDEEEEAEGGEEREDDDDEAVEEGASTTEAFEEHEVTEEAEDNEEQEGSERPDLADDISDVHEEEEDEEAGTSAMALLGYDGPSQTPRSSTSDIDMRDDSHAVESTNLGDEPSMPLDDMFSPPSDLVVETPPSDHLAASHSAAFPDSAPSHSFSPADPPLEKLDLDMTTHSYNGSSFRRQEGIHAISVSTSFKGHTTTDSPDDIPADDSQYLRDVALTTPTPLESEKFTPIVTESVFAEEQVEGDHVGALHKSLGMLSPTQPLACLPPHLLDESTPRDSDSPAERAQTEDAPETPIPDEGANGTPAAPDEEEDECEEEVEGMSTIPRYLKPYAVAPVEWDPESKVMAPALLRGVLRPYQQAGLEWLASLHTSNLNGILADEMGLGKTIQTIALLAHLACDRGIWGPHLIIVPTSVLLNWEMEFKKFLPGFRVLAYHGPTARRKELRRGWNDKFHFNVCITSYTLASRDAHIFKRKPWYYMILDEAHMIKNFKSQRWNILLMFRSFRRLLLTGTPLQNNLTELWALLQFLMSGTNFANLKEFGEWFANPLEKAIEMGNVLDDETQQRVAKLHQVLRPYLLRRLKRDVEKELPSKYEHVVLCPLSKRQRFLYDEFMSRAQTRNDLQSGVYQKIANILMQLRKVCNHPDLFETRQIVTSFAMPRSAVADFEIKELLVRRQLLHAADFDAQPVDLDVLGLQFIGHQNTSLIAALETRRLDASAQLPFIGELPGEPPPHDVRTAAGYRAYRAQQQRAATIARWTHVGYLNRLRCARMPLYSTELLRALAQFARPIVPLEAQDVRTRYLETGTLVGAAVKSYAARAAEAEPLLAKFVFATPPVVARDVARLALAEHAGAAAGLPAEFDAPVHAARVRLQIAFPDPSLLQYDCGKLQALAELLRERRAGGHRVLVFTQMTRILDILEVFLNFHGYLYLRLDGATKIEDRQYVTERFNADPRVFCFIASSRSGGVGINLTGADTVVFYDSDFNPQMDRQCEDRAHRIGQSRDVHIYRLVSAHTVEEALLRKANQKRSLGELVIRRGEFDWRGLFGGDGADGGGGEGLARALEEFEDSEDVLAARVAAREAGELEGADRADFGGAEEGRAGTSAQRRDSVQDLLATRPPPEAEAGAEVEPEEQQEAGDEEGGEEGGTTVEYMLSFVRADYDFFCDWRL